MSESVTGIDGEEVRDLSDKLTADKIAALKNKRKKNMARNTIKSVDDRYIKHFQFELKKFKTKFSKIYFRNFCYFF